MDTNETPIWKFEHVEIKILRSYFETPRRLNGVKSTTMCHAIVDFGFFMIYDIGIIRFGDNRLAWSNDFGWSPFKFMSSQIDNPYCEEVTKLARMIKNELEKHKDTIIEFLDDPSTMPLAIRHAAKYYCSYCYYTHNDHTKYGLSECEMHINANHGARANAKPLPINIHSSRNGGGEIEYGNTWK